MQTFRFSDLFFQSTMDGNRQALKLSVGNSNPRGGKSNEFKVIPWYVMV